MDKYASGVKGEEIAKEFLQAKGYAIVAQNIFYPNIGEIDIIAKDGNILVFVEVRTRTDNFFGNPLETITKAKIKKIVNTSRKYLSEHKISCQGYRYDVIGILYDKITHIENAFYARWN